MGHIEDGENKRAGRKRLLITGANGCVGYEIINRLHDKFEIIAVDKTFSNLNSFAGEIKCITGDICALDEISSEFEGVDAVVHLAAKVHEHGTGEDVIEQFRLINTHATQKLFELCVKYKVKKVIYFSTIAVYGGAEGSISEATAVNPVSPYAKSKYEAEQIGLKMCRENGLPLIILRPATIYGYLDRGNYRQLISLANKGLNVIPGKGCNFKPIIYVKDVAGVVESILDKDYAPGETMIICQGNYMYNEMLGHINRAYGLKPLKISIPIFLIDLLDKCLKMNMIGKLKTLSESITIDNSKMLNELKYVPEYDFYSGLLDSKEYYVR